MITSFTWLGANIRIPLLTLLMALGTTYALGQSVTGCTGLTLLDKIYSPNTRRSSDWAFRVLPAPYGEVSISEATVGHYISDWNTLLCIQGIASDKWTNVSLLASAYSLLTTNYSLSSNVTTSFSRARGFDPIASVCFDLHSAFRLDSLWTLACGIDKVAFVTTAVSIEQRALRIGLAWNSDVVASADVVAHSNQNVGIELNLLSQPITDLTIRFRIASAPLHLGIDTQLQATDNHTITLEYEYMANIGHRASVVVELLR